MLLTLVAGCYGEGEITTGEAMLPESSASEYSTIQETEELPDATETDLTPETTTVPETTSAPETTVPPETTEPPVIIPQASVTTFDELQALAADDKLEAGTVISIVQNLDIASDVIFSVPVTLSVKAEMRGEGRIIFNSADEGVVEILIVSGIDTSGIDFVFDIPKCD
jgi:hypothetical protein